MGTPIGGRIQHIAAAANSGSGGACLFTLDQRGSLSFTKQSSPGGPWQAWQGPKYAGQPVAGAAIACADQNTGCLMLVMIEPGGNLWSIAQEGPSGAWLAWQGPKIGGQQFSFKTITAGRQTAKRGIQLMAVDVMGEMWSCYQTEPGTGWSGWSNFTGFGPTPTDVAELALSGQNNGCLMLIARAQGAISAVPQNFPSGAWGEWSPNGLDKKGLTAICACEQGGTRGLAMWGLNGAGMIWCVFQDTAGGPWDPWLGPGWNGQPEPFVSIAAAGQNNGCTIFFGVGKAGDLWSVSQTAPGGGWGSWGQMMGPPG
jgi:hypothetical protein